MLRDSFLLASLTLVVAVATALRRYPQHHKWGPIVAGVNTICLFLTVVIWAGAGQGAINGKLFLSDDDTTASYGW